MATDVAVVIGNYEGERLLPDCLASIQAQTHVPAEVIVVDAGSLDGSVDVAERWGARVIVSTNRGLGSLYNRGAAEATSSYVLFLNNDVALAPACVERLAAALDADDRRFAADPQQVAWGDGAVIHGRTTITRGRLFGEYLPGLHLDPNVAASGIVDTVSAHGAAMLVRRTMHVDVGGFDETFFLEWEDLDLCWRAWLRGWSSVYVPGAVVRHRVGAVTTPALAPRRSASSHHNLVRFALKCLPARAAAIVVIGELLRLPAHPAAVAGGAAALVPELPEILRARRSLGPHDATFAGMLALSRPS